MRPWPPNPGFLPTRTLPVTSQLHTLFLHLAWADARLLQALETAASPPAEAIREYGHALGADEVWLARLQGRPPCIAV